MAIQLEDLGCKPVDGDLYSDWLWHCRWCGYDEYIEIPREWPIPKGPNNPSVLVMWIDERLVNRGWYNVLPNERRINGRVYRGVCVYLTPFMNVDHIYFNFKERLCEVMDKCNCE